MMDDLDHRLRDLTAAAGARGRLPDAAEVRRRGDRRQRRQMALAAVAVVVAVGGVAAGLDRFESTASVPPAGPTTIAVAPTTTSRTLSPTGSTPEPLSPTTPAKSSSSGRIPAGQPVLIAASVPGGVARLLTVTNDGAVDVSATVPGPNSKLALMPVSAKRADRTRFLVESLVNSEEIDAYCLTNLATGDLGLKVCNKKDLSQIFDFGDRQDGTGFVVSAQYGLLTVKGITVTSTLDETPTVFTVTATSGTG